MTKDLYTTKDVKEVREILLKEQKGLDAITKKPTKKPCLDHRHDSEQLVRGVLDFTSNSFLGHVENAFKRRLEFCVDEPLSVILRACAQYLEDTSTEDRFRHPKWIKKCLTEFRKLSASTQNEVLKGLGSDTGKNPAERLKKFNELCLTRGIGFCTIRDVIKQNGGFVN